MPGIEARCAQGGTGQQGSSTPTQQGRQGQHHPQALVSLQVTPRLGHRPLPGHHHHRQADQGNPQPLARPRPLGQQQATGRGRHRRPAGIKGEGAAGAEPSQGGEVEAVPQGNAQHPAEQKQAGGPKRQGLGAPQQQRQLQRQGNQVFEQIQLGRTQRRRQPTPQTTGQGPAEGGGQGSSHTDRHRRSPPRLAIIATATAPPWTTSAPPRSPMPSAFSG